jgi:post-segregation antitoxin (ccd killing protein)
MGTITIGRNGVEYIHINVILPRQLRDFARNEGLSMSGLLRESLERKIAEHRGNGQ